MNRRQLFFKKKLKNIFIGKLMVVLTGEMKGLWVEMENHGLKMIYFMRFSQY